VNGASGAAVVWSVDGVAGGNTTVGTIDASGNYTAGANPATHIIKAALVSNLSVSGSATVGVNTTVAMARSMLLSFR